MTWTLLADQPPPPGIPVIVCWNPAHITRPIDIAAFAPGLGWYADGCRVPTPVYWAPTPVLPSEWPETA